MAKTAVRGAEQNKVSVISGLDSERLIEMYRLVCLSRRTDDREILLKRQQKIFFQISGAGHEALGVAAGMALKPGYDWFYPYYRDRTLCLTLGMTPYELLLAVGCAEAGRYFVSHPEAAKKTALPNAGADRGAQPDYRQFKDVIFHA